MRVDLDKTFKDTIALFSIKRERKKLLKDIRSLAQQEKYLLKELDDKIIYYSAHLRKINNLISLIKQQESLISKLDSIEDTEPNSRSNDYLKHINYEAFVTIAAMDLLIIRKSLFLHKENDVKGFFVKQAYLLIYESLLNYHMHSKFISDDIKTKYPQFQEDHKLLVNKIRDFKRDFEFDGTMKMVRNYAAAHPHVDFPLYFQTISMINNQKAVQAIDCFLTILDDLRPLDKKMYFDTSKAKIKYEDIDVEMEKISFEFRKIDEKISKVGDSTQQL